MKATSLANLSERVESALEQLDAAGVRACLSCRHAKVTGELNRSPLTACARGRWGGATPTLRSLLLARSVALPAPNSCNLWEE